MKRLIKLLCFITFVFLVLAGISYYAIVRHFENEFGMRNVVMNRIVKDYESYGTSFDMAEKMDEYRNEHASGAVPSEARFVAMGESLDETDLRDSSSAEREYVRPIRNADGTLIGFVIFRYNNGDRYFTLGMAAVILLISYFAIMITFIIGYHKMVKPFNSLSEYPEKLAKGRLGDGLPETKSKLFGKYIWGMNMLKDEIQHKNSTMNAMEKEKQTLIVSIAHGIKTPLSNIKLYAQAIERGIYHEDKKPNPKDAETAEKIMQNVDKVELLVKEIMDKSTKVETDYKPDISAFYIKELAELVEKEYSGRTGLLHIPFEVKCENNPLVNSDKDGIYTIISQLLENAIKYGSGQGINVSMGRQDEDIFFTVKNKGNVLSDEETAYVFKSFWRGSNSSNVEGQGIGLYVSKTIAECLGGDIFMKAWRDEDTTEVTLIIPDV